MFVTVFFMLSGALLYYNNSKIVSVKHFYYKRWKAIYPMFYIAFIPFFIINILRYGQIFYKGAPLKIILSILGIDGYFIYRADNYYMLGEWFLGAIIMLYVVYPVLLYCINNFAKITMPVLVILWLWSIQSPIFLVDDMRNLFSCIISFAMGIIFVKYRLMEKRLLPGVSLIGVIILSAIKIPFYANISVHLLGACLFGILFYSGKKIMNNSIVDRGVSEISGISYAVFLLHHIIMLEILKYYNPVNGLAAACMLGLIIVIVLIAAKILTMLTNIILKRKYN